MKRTAIAALAACAAMAITDVVCLSYALNGFAVHAAIFSRVVVGLGPGFVALAVVYLLYAPRSRAQLPVALALLLVRFLVYDHQFGAPKRADLDRDLIQLRQAGQAVPQNYDRAAGDLDQAYLAAGCGCLVGVAVAFGISRRRHTLPHIAAA